MSVTATREGKSLAGRLPVRKLGLIAGRKLVELTGVVLIVTLVTTVLIRLAPGSPATNILGPAASAESIADLEQALGLDQPLLHQILTSLRELVRGDLGQSLTQGQPVAEIIADTLPLTLVLIGCALVLALAAGVPLGLAAGLLGGRAWDGAIGIATSLLIALPPFVVGTLLVLVFAIDLGWLPAGGSADVTHLVLPSVTLGLLVMSSITRSVYRATLQAVEQEYVDAARSRGVPGWRIALRHLLPVVSIPLIPLLCYSASLLIGGAIIVEAVFGVPGFGSALNTAVLSRDYPTIAGMAMVVSVLVVLITAAGDVGAALADPRRRIEH